MQLDEKNTQALCKALQTLSDEHVLGMDAGALTAAARPHPNDASFYLETLFPKRTARHAEEQGEAPSGAYPRLLALYAKASGGAFDPQDIEADSDDGWNSLTLIFRHLGKKQRIKVSGVEDSDWFAPDFVKALNRFAKRIALPGRWVDFHNGDDACTSIYVPEAAQSRFKALKKKYSTPSEEDEGGWTPELLASALASSIHFPPALEVQLDKVQLKLRKAAWPPIEARLRDFHTKSETKLIERYYLSGTEPKTSDLWDSDPLPLVYRLWLHPDQSDASWCAITERVLSYQGDGDSQLRRDRFIDTSLIESRKIFQRQVPGGADFLSDARERLTLFLQGDRYRHQGERLYYHGAFRHAHYVGQCQWLDATAPAERRGMHCDPSLAEYWVDYLCGPDFERFMRGDPDTSPYRYFRAYLHQIARYTAPVDGGPDHARQDYCQRCRDALDARALPAPLDTWWAQAKAKAIRSSL